LAESHIRRSRWIGRLLTLPLLAKVITDQRWEPGKCRDILGEGLKNDMIRDMIVRKGGATYDQILKAAGWKRASGTVSVIGKTIKGFPSYKNAKGERAFKAA
jgi:hypothetical protein